MSDSFDDLIDAPWPGSARKGVWRPRMLLPERAEFHVWGFSRIGADRVYVCAPGRHWRLERVWVLPDGNFPNARVLSLMVGEAEQFVAPLRVECFNVNPPLFDLPSSVASFDLQMPHPLLQKFGPDGLQFTSAGPASPLTIRFDRGVSHCALGAWVLVSEFKR